MALMTFLFPTSPQSIPHFLETTTLFLKQSNCSQSKINPVIKVHGIFKFQRTRVTVFHSNCCMLFYWLFRLKQYENAQLNHSRQTMNEKQDQETKTIPLLKPNCFNCAPGGPRNGKEECGKWRTYGEARSVRSCPLIALSLENPAAHPSVPTSPQLLTTESL